MTEVQAAFIEEFNKAMMEPSTYRYITRNSDLQRETCKQLEDHLAVVSKKKADAVQSGDEQFANVLLGCESLRLASIAEIKMYLSLKEDDPDAAWEHLITAQDRFGAAIRADGGFAEMNAKNFIRLERFENLVFPRQTFMSTGWIVGAETCSICGQEYEDCEHVAGRPYMGEFCYVSIDPVDMNHVAVVDEPASKHCRITSIGVANGRRNVLTFCIEPNPDQAKPTTTDAEGGLSCQAILATTGSMSEAP